ncbi:hypothetical protein SAMN02745111_00315 [Eubacterium uniforme]|uniref:Uncharacterized protein n=1 Tax=Eubacterium uniforme TaxID=39495 RepID=A0A1T4V7L1_9FIRM|nr:hypothetical protein [Eubacterium uniforme]SKA60968.1 hypothetical protein SAMN02745111_00315 [Eubacterium uniforme]
MDKFNRRNIDNLIKSKVTKSEIMLYMFLVKCQDTFGCVKAVRMTETINALNITKKSFYNAIEGLERKGLVIHSKNTKNEYYHDFIVRNNNEEDMDNGYIDISKKALSLSNLNRLKAGEILLLLKLLSFSGTSNNSVVSYRKKTKEFFKLIKELFMIKSRTIRLYIKKLMDSELFYAEERNHVIHFHKLGFMEENGNYGETYNIHLIRRLISRFKIKAEETVIIDVAGLIRQYAKRIEGNIETFFNNIFVQYQEKELNSKLFHRILTSNL